MITTSFVESCSCSCGCAFGCDCGWDSECAFIWGCVCNSVSDSGCDWILVGGCDCPFSSVCDCRPDSERGSTATEFRTSRFWKIIAAKSRFIGMSVRKNCLPRYNFSTPLQSRRSIDVDHARKYFSRADKKLLDNRSEVLYIGRSRSSPICCPSCINPHRTGRHSRASSDDSTRCLRPRSATKVYERPRFDRKPSCATGCLNDTIAPE